MTFYLLPRLHKDFYKHISIELDEEKIIEPIISESIASYLYNIKEHITCREKQWDTYKKYTNPCEYIHSIIPYKKRSVSKYKPLSRSFFKMIEITKLFNMLSENSPIKTFHLAEGPGGFIEAMAWTRKSKDDQYIGMTLLHDENDSNIPAWKKSQAVLKDYPNIFIENGKDGTGNILSPENFQHCVEKYGQTMDYITGDGGFDFSIDFNRQEQFITRLLFGQIAYALCMQKVGGTFILKIFDSFMQHTVDFIAILSSSYKRVYLTKPQTSRYANSEKYLVCMDFIGHDSSIYNILYDQFCKMRDNPNLDITKIISKEIPYCFIQKLEEYNAIYGQKQIHNINFTISIIENKNKQDKIDELIKLNVQKSVDWCMKYDIPHYTSNSSNIFLM
jgi:23S rRNA U2552 (ribose-2'-O)-methylase RlmE/FtsJ